MFLIKPTDFVKSSQLKLREVCTFSLEKIHLLRCMGKWENRKFYCCNCCTKYSQSMLLIKESCKSKSLLLTRTHEKRRLILKPEIASLNENQKAGLQILHQFKPLFLYKCTHLIKQVQWSQLCLASSTFLFNIICSSKLTQNTCLFI